jgi:cytidylate kinase
MKKIILIGHHKGSGKDTFAKMLSERIDKKTYITTFAEYMRGFAIDYFGLKDVTELENWKRDNDKKYRRLMITLGKFLRDNFDGQLIGLTVRDIDANDASVVLIPDLRLHREYRDMVERYGRENVITVFIKRDDVVKGKDIIDTENDTFAYDHIIDNNGTLLDLAKKIDEFIKVIGLSVVKDTLQRFN